MGDGDMGVSERASRARLARKIDRGSWALFFIWLGIVLLADLGRGAGPFGVGAILLGAQGVRRSCGLRAEGFWTVVGALLLAGGVWERLQIEVSLFPILLIIAGLALLASVLREK